MSSALFTWEHFTALSVTRVLVKYTDTKSNFPNTKQWWFLLLLSKLVLTILLPVKKESFETNQTLEAKFEICEPLAMCYINVPVYYLRPLFGYM